jgi:hypothetical protein
MKSLPASSTNPYGVHLAQNAKTIAIAQSLGAAYIRFACFLQKEDQGDLTDLCRQAHDAALKIVLTIRYSIGDLHPTVPPRTAAEWADYHARVDSVLGMVSELGVVYVAVEDEQETGRYFTGTATEYLAMLQAVADVARGYGVIVVDGGLTSRSVTNLTLADLVDAANSRKTRTARIRAQADAVAFARVTQGTPPADFADVQRRVDAMADELTVGRQFLAGYGAAGAFKCNWHGYDLPGWVIRKVAKYLAKASNLPLMTNELGQRSDDEHVTEDELRAARAAGCKPIIWYSMDKNDGTRGLAAPDGALRPTGQVFQRIASGA